jgi:hypothetical protein
MGSRHSHDSLTHASTEGKQMIGKGKTSNRLLRRSARIAVGLAALAVGLGISAAPAAAIEINELGSSWTNLEGNAERQAGTHPDVAVRFFVPQTISEDPESFPLEAPHRVLVDLPPGLIGNISAAEFCPEPALKAGYNGLGAACPMDSQIGIATINPRSEGPSRAPIYNVTPPDGSPAMFAFNILGVVVRLTPTLRPGEYAITIDSGAISQGLPIPGVETVFWGVPSDPAHDPQRYFPVAGGAFYVPGSSTDYPRKPFMSTPTSCPGTPARFAGLIDGWKSIGQFASTSFDADFGGDPFTLTGCDQVPFTPSVEARPTTNLADSPSGLDVKITTPQNANPDGLSEAHLRDVEMTLPAGMTVNPSSANGLGACSPGQIGLTTPVGVAKAMFNGDAASCPANSKLGTVQINTPLIDHPLNGAIYLAEQSNNPFNTLLALYISVEDPLSGTTIKLAGQAVPDPQTGQLKIDFKDNPQLPFEEMKVNTFTGPRAALKTPLSCGGFSSTAKLTPWSAPAGAPVSKTDAFAIERGAGGGACLTADAQAPNRPTFAAGTVDPTAGAHTPFTMKIARADGTAPIKAIRATLPKGLLGKLAGIPYCPEASLAAAAAKPGNAEQAVPSCPASSQVGNVNIAAGAGSTPFQATGKAYLTGPYKGAPLSLAIITPAVAGPFDLGTVVVRNALRVDPESAVITAVSDEIPTILRGIPLDIRQIVVSVDRPGFILNPTSCDPMAVGGGFTSVFGTEALLTDRFQVGGCEALGFKPKLALALKGSTARGKYPALRAQLTARPGDANIARSVVTLPRSEFLAQEHIRTVCTRVQFAANACPPASVYGKATAWSPLLDAPLSGPVYLRSSSNKLPDLVADLNGQIRVALVGRIDSVRGGIRASFESVPDAPVSKFVLEMQGGKKGLLVNSRNLCKSVNKAEVEFSGQNGKSADSQPVLTNGCKKKARKGGKGRPSGRR